MGVRSHSDACATDGGPAAVALFDQDFNVSLAHKALENQVRAPTATGEGLFASVASVASKNHSVFRQQRGSRGSRLPGVVAIFERFWRALARILAFFWIERAPSCADASDAPSGGRPLLGAPQVTGELAAFQEALPWRRTPQQPAMSLEGENIRIR